MQSRPHKCVAQLVSVRCVSQINQKVTTHVGHAQEEVQKLPLDRFDAIVAVSGDGLVYEVFNGYAGHAEPAKAFCLPVAPIPTGSGNGLALNIIGIDVGSRRTQASFSFTFSLLRRNSKTSQSRR